MSRLGQDGHGFTIRRSAKPGHHLVVPSDTMCSSILRQGKSGDEPLVLGQGIEV